MRIQSLQIKNYRSCIDTSFDLLTDLTVLIGPNGSGKSNILNAILLLKKLSETRHYFFNEKETNNQCFLEVNVKYKSSVIKIKAKISFENNEDNEEHIVKAEMSWDFSDLLKTKSVIEINPEIFSYSTTDWDGNVNYVPYLSRKSVKDKELLKQVLPIARKIMKYFSEISYYSASQFVNPSNCPNYVEIEDGKPIRKYFTSEPHRIFITDLYRLYKNSDKKNFHLYLNLVNRQGIGLVDNISFQEFRLDSDSYKVLTGGKVSTLRKNKLLVVPNFLIDSYKLSPNQLSEGTFRVLALVFYLLIEKNKLTLIEEPEVSVHHGLLNNLVSIIKAKSKVKQLIISTHSDFVLDQVKPENLIIIERTKNAGTLAQELVKNMSENEYRELKEYLESSGNLGDYWKEAGFTYEKD